MKNNIIEEKSKNFAIKIVNLTSKLQHKNEYILANQILRSGTSIGANVAESVYASSKADFINKLNISQKEAGETKYWLELLYETEKIDKSDYDLLIEEIKEILSILSKILISSNINGNSY